MSKWRSTANASVVSLGLMLAACGGGGGGTNSTPPPAPTPTAPTPTPSTPAPTPPPTGVNDDLLAPLSSETFRNDAVRGTAAYPASASGTSSAAFSTVTISYDAASSSYTVTNGGQSQTFRPQDRNASLSSAEGDVFVRTSGDTGDSLLVTPNSLNPGTRSNPKYRYVGGAVWQRTVTASSAINGTIDAVAFGVETPAAAVPRTGAAEYPVTLIGVGAFGDGAFPARGNGALSVNFAGNSLTGTGTLYGIGPTGREGDRRWTTTASLSSAANTFSGTFVSGLPFGGATDATGQIHGRFFGPAAEELGASWYWRDNFLGTTFAGVMLGKNGQLFPTNSTGLAGLAVDEDLADAGLVYRTRIDTTNGANFLDGEPNPHPESHPGIRYSETTQSYILNWVLTPANKALLPADLDAAASAGAFNVFRFTDSGTSYVVRVLKPNQASEIALTYTAFANWTSSKPDILTYVDRANGWIAFGQATPAGGVPTTGTAAYTARVYGMSDVALAADGTFRSYDVTGTADFQFNFAAGTLAGSMTPSLVDPKTAITYNLGAYTFTNTVYSTGSQTFRGSFNPVGVPAPGTSHFFNGTFTGPAAQELFARWQSAVNDPVTSQKLDMFGVMVGKKN